MKYGDYESRATSARYAPQRDMPEYEPLTPEENLRKEQAIYRLIMEEADKRKGELKCQITTTEGK